MPPGAGPTNEPQVSQQQLPAEISETANSYAVSKSKAPQVSRNSDESSSDSTSDTSEPKTEEKTESTTVATAATPRLKKATRVASASRRQRTDRDYADARRAMPAVPQGAVRAQYLGTAPDGSLIFGLPSSERGYVAPGESRRRRSRRVNNELPPGVEALPPVLPALPADE